MTQTYGRHRGSTMQDKAGNIAAGLIAVAALGGAGVIAVQSRSGSGAPSGERTESVAPAAGVRAATATGGAIASPRAACPDATDLYAPGDLGSALTQAIERYRIARGKDCSPVQVQPTTGPAALADTLGTDRAGLWLARGDADVAALPATVRRGRPTVVAGTPVVLAMPAPLADAWGWPTTAITTSTWRSWMLDRTTWATSGHPQWGTFSVQMADPVASPTSALGFATMMTLANGGPLTDAPDYTGGDERSLALIKTEHHIRSVVPDDASVLPGRDQTLAQIARQASAYLTTERAVAAHNATNPTVPLVALPLGAGAASVPLVILSVGSITDGTKGVTTAEDFRTWLASDAGGTALRAAGLRAPDGTAPTDKPVGVAYAAAPLKPQAVPAQALSTAAKTFSVMHTRISSLALIDASGSMNQKFAGADISRIDLVRSLSAATYRTASPRARSGVWFFHTADGGTPLIERATTLDVNETTAGGVPHSGQVITAVKGVTVRGGTPLYQAVREAYDYTRSRYDPHYVNQLVVLSDGANRDSTSPDTLADLLRHLQQAQDPRRPVRIICLGYGAEADMGALQAIASATGGRAAQVGSPAQMPAAVKFALFSL
ncbi:substrate-binding domain-containing protein [Arsenicicoccus dermatophilus]|uniref:vWA domain-containing protein n=1 Tax=Arsenicicoccus dermatophilus TaxID=1076331 RepID=UPI0039174370